MTIQDAKNIADLARLVEVASDAGAPEELIAERYQILRMVIPDDNPLAKSWTLHDKPGCRAMAARLIAEFALREARGEDTSIHAAPPEVQAAVARYLAEREQQKLVRKTDNACDAGIV